VAFAPARALALAVQVCLAATAPALPAGAADTLTVGGTGSANELLRMVGAAFEARSGVTVDVVASLGSTGAIHALADGVLDVVVAGRRLTPKEVSEGLSVALSVRTPFVLATSHPSPGTMTLGDIANAYRSERAVWDDGSPIRPILRPRTEADTALMGELFPGLAAAMAMARQRPDVPVAATDQDNADMAEQTPGSLIGSTLTQLRLEKRKLRVIPIEGLEPSFENFERGIYPYAKPLNFIVRTPPAASAERFIGFLRSPEGQAMLRKANIL